MLSVLGLFVSMSAHATLYNFTDFNKTLVKYNLTGFSTPEQAQEAAVSSLDDLLNGILPTQNMTQSNGEKCQDVNRRNSKKAISKYIMKRGKYSGVRAHGFTLGESFDAQGNAVYTAKVRATIPCLKQEKD